MTAKNATTLMKERRNSEGI